MFFHLSYAKLHLSLSMLAAVLLIAAGLLLLGAERGQNVQAGMLHAAVRSSTSKQEEAPVTLLAQAEQAQISGPARTGVGWGAQYVEFGSPLPPPAAFQPSAPYYATFYYPWYGTPALDDGWSYWTGHGSQPPDTWFGHYLPDPLPEAFDPAHELYSSHDASMIYWQLGKMAEAKIEVAISSWWGVGERTDNNFRFLVKDVMQRSDNPYPNLRWALYYEQESTGDPTVAQLVSDLNYIAANYAVEPGYLRIDGKPVIFVYSAEGDGAGMVERWNQARRQADVPFYVVLKVFSGYRTVSPQPDSWHQYGPATRTSNQEPYSFTVSPGFWYDNDNQAPRLPRDLDAFRTAVSAMVASGATWKLVTTWNEWGEGTAVEPGEQVRIDGSGRELLDPAGAPFKNAYIDVLHQLLPPLEENTTAALPAAARSVGSSAAVSFTFGASGDLGAATAGTASFQTLAKALPNFFLALGDLSYNEVTPETVWCSYVKSYVGADYPFEVLVGNHEQSPTGPNGFVDNFAACLPDRLHVTGLYAHRYYFDYPAGAPLARFILIDPDLPRGAKDAQYCTDGDTENCDWLKARSDEARRMGLWTVVGMHKNCLTIGAKDCEIGADLLNVLIEHKVDLVLQGHDHGYQRSKQLSINSRCDGVAAGVYDADCVVDDGSDGTYRRGAGLVFAISGAFGRSAYPTDTADAESGYLARWMDPAAASNGFMWFTITEDQIDARFIHSRGVFTDHFTIAGSAAAPTPAPPAPTPAATPCPAPPTNQGSARLSVDVPADGDYYIWSRMMPASSTNKAFWLQVDDGCAWRVAGSGAGGWRWINNQDSSTGVRIHALLAAGTHAMALYGDDAGVRVDKLILTTDANLTAQELPGSDEGVQDLFLPLVIRQSRF